MQRISRAGETYPSPAWAGVMDHPDASVDGSHLRLVEPDEPDEGRKVEMADASQVVEFPVAPHRPEPGPWMANASLALAVGVELHRSMTRTVIRALDGRRAAVNTRTDRLWFSFDLFSSDVDEARNEASATVASLRADLGIAASTDVVELQLVNAETLDWV